MRRAAGRRRTRGGDRAARVVPGRRAPLRLRPHRLVEPLPRRRAADRASRPSSAARCGSSASAVRVPGRRPDRVHVLARRPRPPRASSTRPASCATCRLELTRIVDLTHRRPARAVRRRLPHALAADRRRRPRTPARSSVSDDDGEDVDPAYVSVPRPLESDDGAPRTRSSIRRSTRTSTAPAGERPPLLVHIHGGPTAQAERDAVAGDPVLDQPRLRGRRRQLRRQHRLRARVPRAAARPVGHRRHRRRGRRGARARRARARPTATRMAITGGSAGGCTTLCALAFPDVFAAGAGYYGVADLTGFATTRTSSSRATTTGWSARGRRPPTCGASARRSTTSTGSARR